MGYVNTTQTSTVVRVVNEIGTDELVTLDEAKRYLRLDNNIDDDLVTGFILAARKYAEKYLNKDILSREREVYYNYLDTSLINLYQAPVTLTRNDDGDLTNFTITVETDDEVQTLVEGDDFIIHGEGDIKIELDSPKYRLTINYTTSGLDDDEIKFGMLALIYKYYYNDGGPNANWKPFLSPFRSFGYYGVK